MSEHIAKKIIEKGYTLDILTRGTKKVNYSGVNEHIICDRDESNSLKKLLRGRQYDIIVDISVRTPSEVNNLIQALDICHVKKYIMCSTASIFEIPMDGIVDDRRELVFAKSNEYCVGKKNAEEMLINSGLNYVVIRPTYIYGEGNNLGREILLIKSIMQNIPIYIENNFEFNPIYVGDLSNVFMDAIQNDIMLNKCILVGSNEVINYVTFVKKCADVCRKEGVICCKKPNSAYLKMPYLKTNVVINTSIIENYEFKFTNYYNGLSNVYEWILKEDVV